MQFISTRGQAPQTSFSDVLLAGLAPDGGLYLPQGWPQLTAAGIAAFKGARYQDVAFTVLSRFTAGSFGDEDQDASYTTPMPEGEPVRDDHLAEEVRDRLIEEQGIDPVDLAVSVTDGIVLLDGLVDDLDARDALERSALDVPGVGGVENRLRQRRGAGEE